MRNMNNLDCRQMMFARRIRYYEVAEKLGISQTTFSRWLQTEMSDERRKLVIKAIKSIK